MLRLLERVQQIRDNAETLIRLNIELKQLEMKRKARLYGIALALAVVALVLVLYAIGFAFAAAATGIAEALPLWAALLIVSFLLLVTAAIVGLVASRVAQQAGPLPEEPSTPAVPELADV